jgi:hypothetical protein
MKSIDLLNNFSESDSIPRFLLCVDDKDIEYILNLSSYPCIIKVNAVIDSEDDEEDEDDEDDEEDIEGLVALLDNETEENEKNFTFDIEIFKLTEKGVKPIGREKSLKSVQRIIKDAIDYYIEQNKE